MNTFCDLISAIERQAILLPAFVSILQMEVMLRCYRLSALIGIRMVFELVGEVYTTIINYHPQQSIFLEISFPLV